MRSQKPAAAKLPPEFKRTQNPGILGIHADNGGFHIKAGLLDLNRSYFAAKLNANFPQNAKRLPFIQGVIALCDAENGYPLALMDSIEVTILRTGAATAVAAKYLARRNSKSILICGPVLTHRQIQDFNDWQIIRFAKPSR